MASKLCIEPSQSTRLLYKVMRSRVVIVEARLTKHWKRNFVVTSLGSLLVFLFLTLVGFIADWKYRQKKYGTGFQVLGGDILIHLDIIVCSRCRVLLLSG